MKKEKEKKLVLISQFYNLQVNWPQWAEARMIDGKDNRGKKPILYYQNIQPLEVRAKIAGPYSAICSKRIKFNFGVL